MFRDISDDPTLHNARWRPHVFTREAIEAELQRLADRERPQRGWRSALLVHPQSQPPGQGVAPGIDVTLHVLNPGEACLPRQRNSAGLETCIAGEGVVQVGDRTFAVRQHDVWNVPSMAPYAARCTSRVPFARLGYSNGALLEKLGAHYSRDFDDWGAAAAHVARAPSAPGGRTRGDALDVELDPSGTRLRGYEFLIDIDVVPSTAHLWRWSEVSRYLPDVHDIGQGYTGRRLLLLYNPATERRNGTTPTFFATLSLQPAERVDIPHRHASAAINYYFRGHGWSKVAGEHVEWKAGDLLLSAPAWEIHGHASGGVPTSALTVQDHPLHIAMDSLVWQETLHGPILNLGSQAGFTTTFAGASA